MRYNRLITVICVFLLGITKILMGVFAIIGIVASFFNGFQAPLSFNLNDDYRVKNSSEHVEKVSVLFEGQEYSNIMVSPKSYNLDLSELPIPEVLTIVPVIIGLAVLYYLLGVLIKVLKSIEEREFFSLANVKRIRTMGFIVLGFSILKWLYGIMRDWFIFDYLEVEGITDVSRMTLSLDFFGSTFFVGLMILLVSNAFEHGVRIQEEQDLTI